MIWFFSARESEGVEGTMKRSVAFGTLIFMCLPMSMISASCPTSIWSNPYDHNCSFLGDSNRENQKISDREA